MRLRRTETGVRMEMTPLIDVIFLLLTFFIFATTVMSRVDRIDLELPQLGSASSAPAIDAAVITIGPDGDVALDGETLSPDEIVAQVRDRRDDAPQTPILVVGDVEGSIGDLTAIVDRLVAAGITDFSLVGRRPSAGEQAPQEGEPSDG